MSNEDRRSEANLVLMCYPHHIVTNDVSAYPVSKMEEIKRSHEQRFSDPSQIMLRSIVDKTLIHNPSLPNNMARLFRSMNWQMDANEMQSMLEEAREYFQLFSRVPIETRHFLGEFASRLEYLKSTSRAPRDQARYFLPVSDVEATFGLDGAEVQRQFAQMEQYRLGNIEEVSYEQARPPYGAFLWSLDNDWYLWLDVAKLCREQHLPIIAICDQLNFQLLDD